MYIAFIKLYFYIFVYLALRNYFVRSVGKNVCDTCFMYFGKAHHRDRTVHEYVESYSNRYSTDLYAYVMKRWGFSKFSWLIKRPKMKITENEEHVLVCYHPNSKSYLNISFHLDNYRISGHNNNPIINHY